MSLMILATNDIFSKPVRSQDRIHYTATTPKFFSFINRNNLPDNQFLGFNRLPPEIKPDFQKVFALERPQFSNLRILQIYVYIIQPHNNGIMPVGDAEIVNAPCKPINNYGDFFIKPTLNIFKR